MASLHQGRDGLPEVFPIFPLTGALLLPHGRLPLNIFEPRYLAMTEDSLAAGRMFGMIQPDPGRPSGPTGPATFRVGCLGRLTSFSESDDGRYLITLTGLIRFRVAEELEMRRGYRRIRADYSGFESDLAPDEEEIGVPRQDLLRELRGYFGRSGLDANWDAIERMPDDMLIVTLCMVCPFEPAEKQALLEARTRDDRAQVLYALLSMGGREEGTSDRIAS
ncbi:MAG TPA: LON peptidase substrate-binding domain-containing protein [Acidisphaera sp.]|nr:LON peptidase substrate-binding domain-containing protein [Acidisphaera sp.]